MEEKRFQIGDKVKKQIFVGYLFSGKARIQQIEFAYGKIIYVEGDHAYVKYKNYKGSNSENTSDLIHVSKHEWDAAFK
jgi:hypothetical protein